MVNLFNDNINDIESVEDRDILDTQSMLESNFLNNLNKSGMNTVTSNAIKTNKINQEESSDIVKTANTEKLLTELYDVRDSLLTTFSDTNYNSKLGKTLTENINKLGSCISNLGGPVENFNPLDHISGLKSPNLKKNADKVIENTKECYGIGNIENTSVKDDGKTIAIIFSGIDQNTRYKATGTITASSSWSGNEAIDYIYTPSEGKMSVKALNENGKWEDRSDHYEIYWELEEDIGDEKSNTGKEVNSKIENKDNIKTSKEPNKSDKEEQEKQEKENGKHEEDEKSKDDFPIITVN